MSDQLKWNLKDGHGRVFGPLTTQNLVELIEKGVLNGEELISRLDTQRWIPVSKYPEFYEVLVETLNKPQTQFSEEDFSSEVSKYIQSERVAPKAPVFSEPTAPIETKTPKKRGRAIVEVEEEKVSLPPQTVTPPPKKIVPKPAEIKKETVELKELSKKKDGNGLQKFLFFIVALVLIFSTLILLKETEPIVQLPTGKIELIFPREASEKISPDQQRKLLQSALKSFEKDAFADYYKTQLLLVQILEGNKKNLDAISLLCMTYRELWPYAKQDSQDLNSLTRLVQMAQVENSLGVHGSTCRLVQAMLTQDLRAQESAVQSALADFPTAAVFYEMKAEILKQQKLEGTAIAFLQKTQGLWKNWIKPYFKEAEYRVDVDDRSNAEIVLKNILQQNPEHNKSLLFLGILEVTHFKRPQGLDKIAIALKEENLPVDLKAKAYVVLANNYVATDSKKALEYAKKAYGLNSTDDSMRNLILQLGGESELLQVKSEDSQLFLLGDSYFKNKNYLAAQAQFKTAYDLNPQNAMAALRAAESLWNLNQSQEAIEWGLKAVKSDSQLSEAYYRLSDFYAQKFDFKSAADILTQAKDKQKNSSTPTYQMYRAFALLELRRNNSKAAVQFAEQALKLYDSDSESLNIISEAFLLGAESENAFKYAAKSIQIDSQNPKSHEVYALALLGYKGLPAAQQYMTNLINTYPNNMDYKMSYAKVLHRDERYIDTIDYLKKITETDPTRYKAWMLMGDSYSRNSQLNESLKSYFKAAALDPSNSEPIFNIGLVYMKSKSNLGKAYKQFQKVIQTNPRYPKANYFAGLVAFEMDQKEQALEYAEKEKKQNPNLADPYILSSEIHAKQQDYSKAANELRKAVQLRPNDSNLYILLAKNYRLSGQLDVAASMLRAAQSKESGNAEIYKEQGAIFEKMGLSEQALAAYSRYIEIKPNADDRSEVEARMRSLGGGL